MEFADFSWYQFYIIVTILSSEKSLLLQKPGICGFFNLKKPSIRQSKWSTLATVQQVWRFFLPSQNSHVLLLAQDFAPPKPLVDLLIEQSPKLAVKLWAKVSVKLWAKLLPFKWRGLGGVFSLVGVAPKFFRIGFWNTTPWMPSSGLGGPIETTCR